MFSEGEIVDGVRRIPTGDPIIETIKPQTDDPVSYGFARPIIAALIFVPLEGVIGIEVASTSVGFTVSRVENFYVNVMGIEPFTLLQEVVCMLIIGFKPSTVGTVVPKEVRGFGVGFEVILDSPLSLIT